MNEGLVTSLNYLREMSVSENRVYHQYVPIIDDSTDISVLANPVFQYQQVANDFMNMLIQRIVSTSFDIRRFRNPLRILEGDEMPVGFTNQDIYVNPAKGRKYNVDDFAGLLQKYEADVKVQYLSINMDLQYPVTVTRYDLKKAFTSWDDLNRFIDGITNSLYNGAYINEYEFTKGIISAAYKDNKAAIVTASVPSTEAEMKTFVATLREYYLNMLEPSSAYNAWAKLGGYGRPVTTWSNPEDIVLVIKNSLMAKLDVNVMATAFNIDKTSLLGRIITVNNFDIYGDDGTKEFDGSNILCFIGDKRWFRIKTQDEQVDEFYNANNRTWQIYLNLTKMYNFSLFSNGLIIASSAPSVATTSIKFKETAPEVTAGEKIRLHIDTTPFQANDTITFTSGTVGKATVEKIDNRTVEVTGVASGTSVITASNGASTPVTGTVTVTVNAAS